MKKVSESEQAFWLGLVLAAVVAVVVFALIQLEHNRDGGDDGGHSVQRVPVEVTPPGGPTGGISVQQPAAQQQQGGSPLDFGLLHTDLGAGVNGHSVPVLPLGAGAEN